MKVSVITVCFNSANTIAATLQSVASQKHGDVEHIVIDGASTDGTVEIVRAAGRHVSQFVSEHDCGIYEAMNKGLAIATGDLVCFLNSDDRYEDAMVLSDVVEAFGSRRCDFVYGDLRMVNNTDEVVRNWKTGDVPPYGLADMQIPHPVLFVSRKILNRISPAFDTSYKIAADLKQQLILINQMQAVGCYVRRPLAVMSLGGASTRGFSSYWAGWRESARAYNEVCKYGGAWYTFKKVVSKFKGLRKLT